MDIELHCTITVDRPWINDRQQSVWQHLSHLPDLPSASVVAGWHQTPSLSQSIYTNQPPTMRLGYSSRCAAASQHQAPSWHLHHTPAVAPAAHRQQQQHPAAPGSLCQHVCNLWAAPRAAVVLVRASNDTSPFSAATTAATAGVVSNGNSSSSSPAAAGPVVSPTSSEPNQRQHVDPVVGTNTWEEEIEETLKLVQLLPPSGE